MTDYAHRRPGLHAHDFHPLPYLGGPEDRLRAAFIDAYTMLRVMLRTPEFADELAAALDPMALIDKYLDQVGELVHAAAIPTYVKVVDGGAALGHRDLWLPPSFAKAEAARKIEPRHRRQFHGPRLHGLRATPIPRPHHSFNANEAHIRAAEALSMRLVTHVNKSQRDEIRKLIVDSHRRGINYRDTALRISNVVGLFPRWQKAVDNLHRRMLANGVTRNIADRRAADYADDLLDKRATMIARTELLRSLNMGRLAGWHDAADRGLLDPQRTVKRWSATLDNRICPECEYLADPHGNDSGGITVVGLDTPFDTEFGDVVMPPIHPHCRCAVVIEAVAPAQVDDNLALLDDAMLADPEMAELSRLFDHTSE